MTTPSAAQYQLAFNSVKNRWPKWKFATVEDHLNKKIESRFVDEFVREVILEAEDEKAAKVKSNPEITVVEKDNLPSLNDKK
jgi:hypothetical protein